MQRVPIAIPWYTPESYAAVLCLLPLSERQNALAYDRFVAQIETTEKGIKSSGSVPYRIPIDVVELKAWHDCNHLNVCGTSLSQFVQVKLAEILRKRSNN
jgi:hypothetical protein